MDIDAEGTGDTMMENETIRAIFQRRSVRAYKPEQLTDEQVQTLLHCAIAAPSARNAQPWHFTVIQNQALLDDFAEAFRQCALDADAEWIQKLGENPDYHVFFHAPTVVLISARADEKGFNLGLAAQNMVLAAQSMGLGSVILGLPMRVFNRSEGQDLSLRLKLPNDVRPFMCVALGYPDQTPNARPRNFDVAEWVR